MIFDSLKNIEQYKTVHPRVYRGLQLLRDTDFSALTETRYEVEGETGPDHDKHFVVAVYLNSNCIGRGEGHSKKIAEQHAAREALKLMGLVK